MLKAGLRGRIAAPMKYSNIGISFVLPSVRLHRRCLKRGRSSSARVRLGGRAVGLSLIHTRGLRSAAHLRNYRCCHVELKPS